MTCVACSSVKVKMRVSNETLVLVVRMAFVHILDWRNIGRGSEEVVVRSSGSARMLRDCSSKEPIW